MIKKSLAHLSTALLLAGIVACSGSSGTAKVESKPEKDPNLCYYDDDPDVRAPDWVCTPTASGFKVSAVGSFGPTKQGIGFARDQAAAAARAKLAVSMEANIKQMVKNYQGSTGRGDAETVDAVSSVTLKEITATTLNGARAHTYKKAPNGIVYALVVLDPEMAASAAKQTMQTSMNNQQALWQQFLGQKSMEEMDAEIDKMTKAQFGTGSK